MEGCWFHRRLLSLAWVTSVYDCVCEFVNEWVRGCANEWVYECVNEWVYECVNGCLYEHLYEHAYECVYEWVNEYECFGNAVHLPMFRCVVTSTTV